MASRGHEEAGTATMVSMRIEPPSVSFEEAKRQKAKELDHHGIDLSCLPVDFPQLEKLEVTFLSDDDVKYICALPNLREFITSDCWLDAQSLVDIVNIESLERFVFGSVDDDFRYNRNSVYWSIGRSRLQELVLEETHDDANLRQLTYSTHLKSITMIASSPSPSPSGLTWLADIPQLEELIFENEDSVRDDVLEALTKLENLRKLVVTGSKELTTAGARRWAGRFSSLEELELRDFQPDDPFLALISQQSKLRKLRLQGGQLTTEGLRHLQSLSNLQQLKLDRSLNHDRSFKAVAYIAGITALEELDLSNCAITDDDICPLVHLSLKKLELRASRATGRELGRLTTLRYLDLESGIEITDEGIAELTSVSHLEHLRLDRCPRISGTGLAGLSGLKHLSLEDCTGITDEGLRHLAGLTSLEYLDLTRCANITDEGVKWLSGLSNLKSLFFEGCPKITDQGVAYLADLKRLEYFSVARCPLITDRGLGHLSVLIQLRQLSVRGCVEITDKGFNNFKNANGSCSLDTLMTKVTRKCKEKYL